MAGIAQTYFRELLMSEEATYGTLDAKGTKLRVTDISPRSDQPLITNMVYTGNRMPSTPFRDNASVGLGFTCPMYLEDEIGWILKHGIAYAEDAGADPYTQTGKVGYSETAIGDLPIGCSFEIAYTDLDTPLYHQFVGGRFDELTIPFGTGGPAEIQCSVICASDDPSAAARMDAGPIEYTSEAASQTDISAITEGGGASTIVLGGEIKIKNNIDTTLYTVGNAGVIAEAPTGAAAVTGTTRMMFTDATQIDKVKAFTESSLGVTWTNDGHILAITIPELRYNNAVPVPGSGSGLILDLSWEAYVGNHADATLLKYVLTNSVANYTAMAAS